MTKVARFLPFLTAALFIIFSQHLPRFSAQAQTQPEFPQRVGFLFEEPEIRVTPEGTVLVTLSVREACSGGEAFLGVFPEEGQLQYPLYLLAGEVTVPSADQVLAQLSLKALESDERDIRHLRASRGGRLAVRLQIWGKKTRILDRIFAYARSEEEGYSRIPTLISEPCVDCVTDHSAVLSFDFDEPLPCRIRLRHDDRGIVIPDARRHFEIELTELAAGSTHHYKIFWDFQGITYSSAEYTFRTAPEAGTTGTVRFAVFCDSRGAAGGGEADVEGVQRSALVKLLNLAYRGGADFIVFPGDLVSGSASNPDELERQFRSWKRITAPVAGSIPVYEGMGNHDCTGRWVGDTSEDYVPRSGSEASEAIFARNFVNPENGPRGELPGDPPYRENVYSFDWGDVHFAVLNTNYHQKGDGEAVRPLSGELQGSLQAEQLDWLEKDLTEAQRRGIRYLFVAAHEPAFPCGGHAKDAMWWRGQIPAINESRNRFWGILSRHRVICAFFGDEHNYSRTLIDATVNPQFEYPVWQIITGGAGAPTYAQDPTVPWADKVRAFFPVHHLCFVETESDHVWLTVLTADGDRLERADLLQR
jgi:hypothetical protein